MATKKKEEELAAPEAQSGYDTSGLENQQQHQNQHYQEQCIYSNEKEHRQKRQYSLKLYKTT